MLTTSLPLIPEGNNKAHLSVTPSAQRLSEVGALMAPQARSLNPRDYERSCTDEGCDLTTNLAETLP